MQKSYCYTPGVRVSVGVHVGVSVRVRMQNVRANVKVLEFKSFCIFSFILSLLIILIKPLTTKAYDRRASGDCGTSGGCEFESHCAIERSSYGRIDKIARCLCRTGTLKNDGVRARLYVNLLHPPWTSMCRHICHWNIADWCKITNNSIHHSVKTNTLTLLNIVSARGVDSPAAGAAFPAVYAAGLPAAAPASAATVPAVQGRHGNTQSADDTSSQSEQCSSPGQPIAAQSGLAHTATSTTAT